MGITTFRAGPDGTHQQSDIPNAQYWPLALRTDFNYESVAGFDTGAEYNNATGIWTPLPPTAQAPVHIDWNSLAWAFNFGANPNIDLNLVLNMFKLPYGSSEWVDFYPDLGGEPFNTFPNTGIVSCHGKDVANPGDQYQLQIFMTTKDGLASGAINADPRHVKLVGRSFHGL